MSTQTLENVREVYNKQNIALYCDILPSGTPIFPSRSSGNMEVPLGRINHSTRQYVLNIFKMATKNPAWPLHMHLHPPIYCILSSQFRRTLNQSSSHLRLHLFHCIIMLSLLTVCYGAKRHWIAPSGCSAGVLNV